MKALIIETDSLRQNIEKLQTEMGNVPIIGVCKANGYGMGLIPFARALLEGGISTLATATLEEAVALREAGIDSEILLLSSTSLENDAEVILDLHLTAAAGSVSALEALNTAAQKREMIAKIHLLLDTGFGRFGFLPGEEELIRVALKPLHNIKVIGTFSHLAKGFGKKRDVEIQYDRFLTMINNLKAMEIDTGICHLANSCAAIKHSFSRLDAVRIGSAFIGRLPMPCELGLVRLGRLEVEVSELHKLKAGSSTGYSAVFTAKEEMRTAIVQAGVSDGLHVARLPDGDRPLDKLRYLWKALKNTFRCTLMTGEINGQAVHCVGLLGMSNSVIDVTGIKCEVGDICTFEVNPILTDSSVPRKWR